MPIGLENEGRYHVKKINDPTGKHDDCWYFVLDIEHDSHARDALLAYAASCVTEHKELAVDLLRKLQPYIRGAFE